MAVAEPRGRITRAQMEARPKRFALDVIRYGRRLPNTDEHRIIKRQLLRSATSVVANYRAARRADREAGGRHRRSNAFGYWLERLHGLGEIDEQSTRARGGWRAHRYR